MKKLINRIYVFLLVMAAQAALFSAAFASSGEGGEHGGADPMDIIWKVVNFAILVFILWKFGRKPLGDFLRMRTETIQKSLEEAREAKELAQRALEQVEEKLKTKDQEIEKIISSAKGSGEREREELIKEGERLSEKLLEQARANIDFELKNAREALKAEAAELAMELAEKKLKERLSDEDRKRLFEEALSKLEGRN